MPGIAGAPSKYALLGDVSATGQLPDATEIEQQRFHRTTATTAVPPNG